MPLYEYKCHSCGDVFEIIQKFSDTPLAVHENCGGTVERLISTSALQFKGSGWYVNDYGKGNSKQPKPGGSNGESKSDSSKGSREIRVLSKSESDVNPIPPANPIAPPANRSRHRSRLRPPPQNPIANNMRAIAVLFSAVLIAPFLRAEDVAVAGLRQPVEILRDRWGVPHIYAQTVEDLFFAQGYMAARDGLCRSISGGAAAQASWPRSGPAAIERDRLARAVRFRGDPEQEWRSYGPDTQGIATAFTNGINAYIRAFDGKRPLEFQIGRLRSGHGLRRIAWRAWPDC